MLKFSLKHFSDEIMTNNTIKNYSLIKKYGTDYFSMIHSKNKRHTLLKEVQEDEYKFSYRRKSAYDYLNDFINIVMPKVEDFVEERLLEKFKSNLDPLEKELVDDAYRIRKYKANIKRNIQDSEPLPPKDGKVKINLASHYDCVLSNRGDGFMNHDYSSIGKYVIFPEELRNEYFPFGCYGNYMKNEFEKTNIMGIMCREEGLKLANSFSYIKSESERKDIIDLEAIYSGKFDFKTMINKFEVFSLFYQEFSLTMINLIKSTKNPEYLYMFTNADIFDSLLTLLVKSLKKNHINLFLVTPTTRKMIIKDILDKIHHQLANKFRFSSEDNVKKDLRISESDYLPISYFEEIISTFKVFKFNLDYRDIIEYCQNNKLELCDEYAKRTNVNFTLHLTDYYENCKMQWRPKDHRDVLDQFKGFNTGALLHGEAGNGKSMTLAYLHSWAKENDWVVFGVNNARKFTHGNYDVERHPSGVYVQPELAREFLVDFKIINYNIIKNAKIEYNVSSPSEYVYGLHDFAGNNLDDIEANPILFDERRLTYTDSWKIHNSIPEEQINMRDYPDHKKNLKEFLPRPHTVLDIVEYGITDERMACNALAEAIAYFMNSTKYKTIFLIDGYNEWFKPTMYDSYKYANFKDYETKIPPYDLAMCRMFMKFNGHMIKQGVKVMASTSHRFGNHEFMLESINFPKNYSINLENLKLDDLRSAIGYYMLYGFSDFAYSEQEIQNLYLITQGNWKQLHLDMRNTIRLLPNYTQYLYRKIRDKEIRRAKNI